MFSHPFQKIIYKQIFNQSTHGQNPSFKTRQFPMSSNLPPNFNRRYHSCNSREKELHQTTYRANSDSLKDFYSVKI